jgi:RNA polymerase sigma-70 factor (ECF subfamily)
LDDIHKMVTLSRQAVGIESLPSEGSGRPATAAEGGAIDVEAAYRDHAAFVWRLLRGMGVREADVPDVVQEVFLTAHRRAADTVIHSSLRAWLYGICIRLAANYRRRRHHGAERLCFPVPEPRQTRSDRVGAKLDLLRALDTLDENQRAVFLLYEVEGLSMPEVAAALACPLTTAYSRLYAGRRRVRAAFRQRKPPGDR